MLQTCNVSSKSFFYYDLENKTIARFPSNSNLKPNGSDNSLYFGMKTNNDICKIFCSLLNVKKIEDILTKSFKMVCVDEDVDVFFNINDYGQIQIKIAKNGTMNKLALEYQMDNFENYDFTKMLIVVDLKNLQIRFKDPKTLLL